MVEKAITYERKSLDYSHADNGLSVYESMLGFKKEQLENKKVLDLGTGQTDRLARELRDAGINATVVGVSPDLFTAFSRNDLKVLFPEWRRQAVAAIAQKLPFKDESFDVILGLYSVTYCSWWPEQVQAWASELGRVLRPGGEARLAPVYRDGEADRAFGQDYQVLTNSAQTAGLVVNINEKIILMQKSLPTA